MDHSQLLPNLFRTEYSKIVAVLCGRFGFHQIEMAEDIVSEAFLKAAETWGLKGIPDNPRAWLYQVARNRTKDYFRRESVFREKVQPDLKQEMERLDPEEIDLSESNIRDSLLQMLYALCLPELPVASQLALALRYLGGFSVEEIANALMGNVGTIEKRLFRAREKLRALRPDLTQFPNQELKNRLPQVLAFLYLLFNEGYFSTHNAQKVRLDLCREATRLGLILLDSPVTNTPSTNALMALFCFHASRFEARTDAEGNQVLYADQDPADWNHELIRRGRYYLRRATPDQGVSRYHLEAAIAHWHTCMEVPAEKRWEEILHLYNRLLQVEYSPMAALNRTYALGQVQGKEVALKEALKINLVKHPLFHSLLAELYLEMDAEKCLEHLGKAIELSSSEADRELLAKKEQRWRAEGKLK